MDQKGRRVKSCSLTGVTGTGKSTKAIEIVKKVGEKSKLDKCLVISFNGSGDTWDHVKEIKPNEKSLKFISGWRKIIWARWKEEKDLVILKEVYFHYRNGSIIFDDCKMYMRANIEHTPYLAQICCDRRHNGYDMYFLAHTPKQIPVDVWSYIDYAWIFKCLRRFKEEDLQCDNAYKVVEAQKKINEKTKILESKNLPIYGVFECIKM